MSETKRGRGRPPTGKIVVHVDLTLSRDVAAALKSLPSGERSRLVDEWLREHPVLKEIIARQGEN
jgi:hypothetical protein